MNDVYMPLMNACTLVTLSYIALKLRPRAGAVESIAVPLFTGIASIIMMLQPVPRDMMILDLRLAPIIIVGLRYGIWRSLPSVLLPAAFAFWQQEPNFGFGLIHGLLIPAVVSPLFQPREDRSGYGRINQTYGLYLCMILFLLRLSLGYFSFPEMLFPGWLLSNVYTLILSIGAVCLLVAMLNDESAKWLLQRQLEMQVNQDGLTKLPNLRSFMEISGNTLQYHPISIMMIDIDDFKAYNDRFGHLQGDDLLREAGRALRHLIRDKDYVARYGGEEFIVMCHTIDPSQLDKIGERLCRGIASQPFGEGRPRITISIGISIAQNAGDDLPRLISEADSALYVSKREGKNRFTFYYPQEADEPPESYPLDA